MTTRPFIQDAALTAMAVNFKNPDMAYIADDVLPRVDVGNETYKYDYYPPEEIFTVPDTTVGRRGAVPQVEFTVDERTGRVLDRGLESPIPQSDIDAAAKQRALGQTGFDPEARAVEGLTHLVKLDREARVAALVTAVANYDADKRVTLTTTDKWTDLDDSDPISDIMTGMDATFLARPNIGVCGRSVFSALRKHPMIVKAIHGNDGDAGIASAAQIAALFDLQAIYIGDSQHNTARKGQAATFSRLWGNAFALIHRSSIATNDNGMPTFGITAEWRRFGGSAWIAGRIPTAHGGLTGGQIIRVGEAIEEKLIAPSTGYLINTPI